MAFQDKLVDDKDEFVESLELTPEKIREDLEKMRDIEGFPIGDVEDILELSDPPYYTAYPNPYIKDFIEMYGTPYDEETDDYDVEPFVGDVSEGKNDPIYRAHTYHTKVPPKAIIKFIEHYTQPGDIVLDGFCGSGMTGVASILSNRKSIISDLSTSAAFIAYNYNKPLNIDNFNSEVKKVFDKLENECSWMFETIHDDGRIGKINYVIWSDVLICPQCGNKYIYWDLAVDLENGVLNKDYNCTNCNSRINKKSSKRSKIILQDKTIDKDIEQTEQVPVLINYSVDKERFNKKLDDSDFELLNKIEKFEIPYWHPINEIPIGYNTNQPIRSHGFINVHHFNSRRNLTVLATIFHYIKSSSIKNQLIPLITSVLNRNLYKGNRFVINKHNPQGRINGPLSGTLYIPSLVVEQNGIDLIGYKKKDVKSMFNFNKFNTSIISTQSTTHLKNVPENTVDYIFTDPPFGANIMYSEMNFLWESWLKVFTDNSDEAIINEFQQKDDFAYNNLMTRCFEEYYRVLKPNRWITVEFHNSRAEIWKIIQNSIIKAGFVIAQVAILDKKHGTIHQDAKIKGSVKNDLVINAYKPKESFTKSFLQKAGLDLELDFIKMHLNKLPIEPNIERSQQMLYSKLLAQYIQNGFEVRLDATDFYTLLNDNFEERDGYWFNHDQILQYEQKLKLIDKISEEDLRQTILGISDEKSAIIWLAQFLQISRTYDEIFIEFSKNLLTSEDKIPELKTILEENFVTEGGKYRLPSDIERSEKEEVRGKRLMKEFNEIFDEAQSQRKIKEVRKEALLYGLMKFYKEKDVEKIKFLGKRLDRNIIDSDDDISAIIDWAMYN